ncbi:MAG: maltotransferase domain-containing protein [Nocardioides sp.]
MVGRIPIMDVFPLVDLGRLPAKATVGEPLPVSATVFREGHDALAAELVPLGPDRKRRPPVRMATAPETPDRYRASFTPDAPGEWGYEIQAWSDPLGTWQHHAEIKVPAGIDVELVFAEGRLLLQRVQRSLPRKEPGAREVVKAAVAAAKDTRRPPEARLAELLSPRLWDVLHRFPLRELVTVAGPFPAYADRHRALFGSWYELFPRSEGATRDPATGR